MGKKLLRVVILTIFSLIIVYSLAFAVPMTINYQGKLTDPNGSILNGEYQINFSLFNTDTNGTAFWSEQQTVTVINGIYNVALGTVNPLTASIFNNENLYLEVGIESEALLPRHRLTSVAFAIRAKEAETVGGFPVEDLITETEFDNRITTQVFTDTQIPDDITINYSATADDADTLDGKDSTEFGDKHSLDAADGDPMDAVYVDNNGNVGIGITNPLHKLSVTGIIESINGGFRFPDGTMQTTAINDGSCNVFLVNSIDRLRELTGTIHKKIALVTGYWTNGDGGGGVFYWDSEEPANKDDGGTIIHPDDSGEYGCWKRIFSGPLNIRWFGAKGNGDDPAADDTAAIQKAAAAAFPTTWYWARHELYFPPGKYVIDSTITIGRTGTVYYGAKVTGAGRHSTAVLWKGAADAAVFHFVNAHMPTFEDMTIGTDGAETYPFRWGV